MAGRWIPRRRRIFVGAEGESERAFAAWLQRLCDAQGRHLHLEIFVAGGGDGVSVAERCAKALRKKKNKPHDRRFVLLDSDRLAEDRRKGRDPAPVAARAGIELVLLEPNLEGLILRLHEGQETRKPAPGSVESDLKKLWPGYRKPPSADDLESRFGVDDLRRAARYDEYLQTLLEALELA